MGFTELVSAPAQEEPAHPLATVMRGEMIRKMAGTLQHQPEKLSYREHIQLSGSASTYLLANDSNVKVPGDIDIAIHTTDGLMPTKQQAWTEQQIKMMLKDSADAHGYDVRLVVTKANNEHCAYITHHFSADEITAVLKQQGLEAIAAQNGFTPETYKDGIKAELPVHYVHGSVSILKEKPYENALPKQDGITKPFVRDDTLDQLSLKLARVMKGNKSPDLNVSDMLDIVRIMDDPKLKEEATRDMELLRMLTVVRIAGITEPDNANLTRTAIAQDGPTVDEFKTQLAKNGFLNPGDAEIKRSIAVVDELLGQVFPGRASGAALTEGEGQFIQNTLTPDTSKNSLANINMDLLVPPGQATSVFDRYPGLKAKTQETRFLNDTVDEHGAMREWH